MICATAISEWRNCGALWRNVEIIEQYMMRNYYKCVNPGLCCGAACGAAVAQIHGKHWIYKTRCGATVAQIAHLTGTLPGVTLAALAKQLASVKRRPRKIPHQTIPVNPLKWVHVNLWIA